MITRVRSHPLFVQQVSANDEALEKLANRYSLLMESIMHSIKGKDTAHISEDLLSAIGRLTESVCLLVDAPTPLTFSLQVG